MLIAAITSVFTVVMNNVSTEQREFDFHILKEKQKVYGIFYEVIFLALAESKSKKSKPIDPKLYLEFKKGLMNWASEELIIEFINYDSKLTEFNFSSNASGILRISEKF